MTTSPLPTIVEAPLESRFFHLPPATTLIEPGGVSPGVTFPAGFLAGTAAAGIKDSGGLDLGVVTSRPEFLEKAGGAAVFTRNAFAAAPVIVSRKGALAGLAAVVMNAGNANACTGPEGTAVAQEMQAACAQALGMGVGRIGVASTGIIGVPLNRELVLAGITKAVAGLSEEGGADFARAIMTTDRYPKSCALTLEAKAGTIRLAGSAKGAGMIAPGMATLLCLITTDAALEPAVARSLLSRAVGRTFNRISVDGQMSTNDTVFLLWNGASGVSLSAESTAQFGAALQALLLRLALMMVADGEGASKVAKLSVEGARSDEDAQLVAREVANSPLVKTALYGGDPNWGRIISAAGAALPGASFPRAALEIGGVRLLQDAASVQLDSIAHETLAAAMNRSEVEIRLDLGAGTGTEEIYFSDLGHEYVTINADYRT